MAYLISMIVGIVGLVAYVVLGTFIENPYLDVMLIFAVPFGFGLVFYITINKNIKKMTENNFVNEYEFDGDVINVATTKNGEVVGTQKVKIADIYKIKITDEYIFIYINKVNAFIVDKKALSDDELSEIKKILKITK